MLTRTHLPSTIINTYYNIYRVEYTCTRARVCKYVTQRKPINYFLRRIWQKTEDRRALSRLVRTTMYVSVCAGGVCEMLSPTRNVSVSLSLSVRRTRQSQIRKQTA